MTVDHKRPLKKTESARFSRTPGEWHVRPPTAQNPSRAVVTALSGFVEIYNAPLTVETAANARLIASAPDLEYALRELMDADAGLERASFNQDGGREILRAAQERWVLARAVAHQVLKRVSDDAEEPPCETATFVGNSLYNRPANDAARLMREGGGA